MNGRLRLGLLALVTVALGAIPLQSLRAQEASARFRVMIPDARPLNDANKKFGERLADELRDLINDMVTHQPVEEREIKNALRQYDLDMEDLDCIRARQLGAQIQSELVFCASYTEEGEGWHVEGSFVSSNGETLEVDPVSVEDRGEEEAAQHFFQSLELLVEQTRYAQFCGEYFASQQWESSLTNCDRAIELNPSTVVSRYTRALVLRETEELDEALAEFLQVLELDPLHEESMQNAGYVSVLLGNAEDGRRYYSSYLELNPANAGVRMRVAYDLATAGDPLGAMQFIEVGLELEPDNTDLLTQHGGFAFSAGRELAQGQEELPAEAADLYRAAIESLTRVYEVNDTILQVGQLRSIINANINLEQIDEAVTLGERFIQTHGEEGQIWSIYADALRRAERVDDAIAALDRVAELDPEADNIFARQGNWLVASGRVDEALPAFQEAVSRGEQSADAVANVIFVNGYQQGVQPHEWDYAIRVIGMARQFEISAEMAEQVSFWLGYSIFNRAVARQEAQTLETAQATLPRFQEALRLFQAASGYASRQNMEDTRQQLIGNVNTYIEIQEAIIRRGR